MRWMLSYNLEAILTVRLRWVTQLIRTFKSLAGASAMMLYVFTGECWRSVQEEMRHTFAPVPTAFDAKLRASSRWLVSAHLLSIVQRFLAPADERHVQMVELLETLRPIALFSIAFQRDARHARILLREVNVPTGAKLRGPPVLPRPPPLPPGAVSGAVSAIDGSSPAATNPRRDDAGAPMSAAIDGGLGGPEGALGPIATLFKSARELARVSSYCRVTHLVAAGLRMIRAALLYAHAAAPEAAHAHPLVLRALDAAIVLLEFAAVVMHLRIELAGLNGLLTLFTWAESCSPRIFTRVRPHKSGLWSRMYCEVEEVFTMRGLRSQTASRRGVRWEEALSELYVPLRSLLAFYGERGLRGRGFPRWAVEDIRRGSCLASELQAPTTPTGAAAD